MVTLQHNEPDKASLEKYTQEAFGRKKGYIHLLERWLFICAPHYNVAMSLGGKRVAGEEREGRFRFLTPYPVQTARHATATGKR